MRKHLSFCLTMLAVVALAAYSCRSEKDAMPQQKQSGSCLSVDEAKSYFEERVSHSHSHSRSDNKSTFIPLDFTPGWDQASTIITAGGARIHVPLIQPTRFVVAKRDSLPGDLGAKAFFVNVSQSLVIVKNAQHEVMAAYIESAVPDKEFQRANKNNRNADIHSPDFSGFVLYNNLDGRLMFLYTVSNGKYSGMISLAGCSHNEVQELVRPLVGRTIYLVNRAATRNDIAWTTELDPIVIPGTSCPCCTDNHTECVCQATHCYACDRCRPCDHTCPGCGNELPCTIKSCSHLVCQSCQCSSGSGGSSGSGSGGSGGSGGGGNGSGGEGSGYTPSEPSSIFKYPPPEIVDKLDEINNDCMGNALLNGLKGREPLSINLVNGYSSWYTPGQAIDLAKSASNGEFFHELVHADQATSYDNYDQYSPYDYCGLNQEAEAYLAMYRYNKGKEPVILQDKSYKDWVDFKPVGQLCEDLDRMLDANGYLIDPSMEDKFNELFEDLGRAIKNSNKEYQNKKWNDSYSIGTNLRTLRKISAGCKE